MAVDSRGVDQLLEERRCIVVRGSFRPGEECRK